MINPNIFSPKAFRQASEIVMLMRHNLFLYFLETVCFSPTLSCFLYDVSSWLLASLTTFSALIMP